MNVKLVSITSSQIAEKQLTAEELIVYTARVSNPGNQLNTETADKLITFLIRNHHWSPFEMVDMTVEIMTSRAIAAQILRHRSFSFQEFSQRYAEVTEMEEVQLRKQAVKNRQSSTEVFNPVLDEIEVNGGERMQIFADEAIEATLQNCQRVYKKLLDKGVAKECARMVLPLTTQTTIYMKGSIRSWIHYLQIRCDLHTQEEHRQVALAILSIFEQNFPMLTKALAAIWSEQEKKEVSSIDQVAEFHRIFNHPIRTTPQIPPMNEVMFRINFIIEELKELQAAAEAGDLVEYADGLGDLQYVLNGAILNAGLQSFIKAINTEIHRSNMSKACTSEQHALETVQSLRDIGTEAEYEQVGDKFIVKRIADGKVMKALGYTMPGLKSILDKGN